MIVFILWIRIFDLTCEGDAAIAAAIKPGPIFTNATFENCLWTTVEDKPIL